MTVATSSLKLPRVRPVRKNCRCITCPNKSKIIKNEPKYKILIYEILQIVKERPIRGNCRCITCNLGKPHRNPYRNTKLKSSPIVLNDNKLSQMSPTDTGTGTKPPENTTIVKSTLEPKNRVYRWHRTRCLCPVWWGPRCFLVSGTSSQRAPRTRGFLRPRLCLFVLLWSWLYFVCLFVYTFVATAFGYLIGWSTRGVADAASLANLLLLPVKGRVQQKKCKLFPKRGGGSTPKFTFF